MQKYLVKVTLPEAIAAKRIADSVRSIGSHFATHAAWRRKAGVCTGMMVVEAADRSGRPRHSTARNAGRHACL